MMLWLAAACFIVAAFSFFLRACYPVPISLVSGADTAVHHVDRCGIALRWAARCGQHQESESIVGAQSGSAAKVDFSSLDLVFLKLGTKMLGLPEQFGVARLLEDMVELVYGVSSVGHPRHGPPSALQPYCTDLSHNCADVVVFLQGTNGF